MAEDLTPKSEFVREKIKDKPKSKKKLLLHLLYMVLCGLAFGLALTLVLAICLPRIIKKANADVPTQSQQAVSEVNPTAGTESTEVVAPTVIEYEQLTLEDYQALQTQLYAIGQECNKSVVSILGVTSDTDIFNKPYEVSGVGSGVIIKDNGDEILILTEDRIVKNRSEIIVTYVNGMTSKATLKARDVSTGLAVLAAAKSDIGADTISHIGVAVMNDFGSPHTGDMVLALGSPLGTPFSILTGNVSSSGNEVSGWDRNYEVLTTDMVGIADGSGILINTKGELVGVMLKSLNSAGNANTLSAVKISEIKTVIAKLCDGKSIPYLGMQTTTITPRMEETYGIPRGVYVRSIAMDSPAMNVGLQCGDVIVKINGDTITSVNAYNVHLMNTEVGDTIQLTIKRKGANGYSEIKYKVVAGTLE